MMQLNTDRDMAPQPIMCSGVLRQRDPPNFDGTDDNDVEEWLSQYERVSAHNRWDDRMKLNDVEFHLDHLAKKWFHNNAATMATWAEFKNRIVEVFGRPAVRKLLAEQRLRTRAQRPGETFTSYIEDVVDLCNRVDSAMAEAEKIKHLMKGIDDDAFQMLLAKDLRTVADIITHCRSYEELRRQRALTRNSSAQGEPLSSLTEPGADASLMRQLQQFVREEVARQVSLLTLEPGSTMPPSVPGPSPRYGVPPQPTEVTPSVVSPTLPALRHMIKEQVAEALPPTLYYAPLTYAEAMGRPVQPAGTSFRAMPPTPPRSAVHRNPPPVNPWRTADNRPICFACRLPGHVARYCRRRVSAMNDDVSHTFGSPHGSSQLMTDVPPRSPLPASGYNDFSRRDADSRRSSSPRRRSLSPMRRRSSPTEQEN